MNEKQKDLLNKVLKIVGPYLGEHNSKELQEAMKEEIYKLFETEGVNREFELIHSEKGFFEIKRIS